ncbi:MAG: chitobiase/beta-hexosaminidase C-terminal domain-containing protein [Lewinellaceae bacterium]|nr:chitobiase/beta-hexosaminidase C-terminal domain-containing protein [Lewinellaceae bacterium]
MTSETPNAVIRYAIGKEELSEKSKVYQQPFAVTQDAAIRAQAFQTGMMSSNIQEAEVKILPFMPGLSMFRQPDPGLTRKVFQPDRYQLENIEQGALIGSDISTGFQLDPQCVSGKCGMVWQGYIYVDSDGGYQFWLNSDDGSALYLDTQKIVDNGGNHGMQEKTGYANLQKGWHGLKVIYFNSGGDAGLKVDYAPLVGKVRQEIPAAALAH